MTDATEHCGKNSCTNKPEYQGFRGNLRVVACRDHVAEIEAAEPLATKSKQPMTDAKLAECNCGGKGWTECPACRGGMETIWAKCSTCKGEGSFPCTCAKLAEIRARHELSCGERKHGPGECFALTPGECLVCDADNAALDDRATLLSHLAAAQELVRELEQLINCPHNDDWFDGVRIEAAHQQERWETEYDEGKEPQDWFWLIGYLGGKCLRAFIAGDTEKAKHHTISTAAVLLNWYRRINGEPGNMRPGIAEPVGISQECEVAK